MNVLSLFDGISCGRIALERANIPVNNYYSSETDKYAIQVSKSNYPDIIQMGDIKDWTWWNIDFSNIDLILAGFPCQAWSVAGKQKGDDDPRGALVHDLINIWNHIREKNPNVKFLFENVKMKKEFLSYINDLFGISGILINSALVSAQNRNRYYWTNIPFNMPIDKKIALKNIIEEGVVDRNKSYCLDANYFKGTNLQQYLTKCRRQIVFKPEHMVTNVKYNKDGIRKLTPIECERLQNLPDEYTKGVSNTQRYKCIGNGWTVDIIAHILRGLNGNKEK